VGSFATRGHTAALGLVARATRTEQPPHALLLLGPGRVGKTTLALDLAAGLLCLAADAAERPCRKCAACRKIAHGNHPDLHILAPEGAGQQIRVGQVQALASDLALLPLEGRFRIAVITSAERLNVDAQNALLKTLEEPPAAAVLVLAADETAGMLPTVVSRCVRLRMGPVASEVIAEMLAETGKVDSSRGAALGRLAGGRPGVALAIAEQPDTALIQARLAGALLDLLHSDRRRRLAAPADLLEDAAALAAAAMGTVSTPAGEPASAAARERPGRRASPAERRSAAQQLLEVWKDVARDLSVAARGGRRELRQHELLDELAAAGDAVDAATAARFLARLDAASRAIDAYANPELVLDALLLEWPRARAA